MISLLFLQYCYCNIKLFFIDLYFLFSFHLIKGEISKTKNYTKFGSSNYIFGSYVDDPSNKDDKFKRIKIRNFLNQLNLEGLDRKKFFLTIKNLKIADENIKFYTLKNLKENITAFKKKSVVVLKEGFFLQSNEVVFRSFAEVIKIVGKKHNFVRGKKIINIIDSLKSKSLFKVTLGGCLIKKVNETVIITKE